MVSSRVNQPSLPCGFRDFWGSLPEKAEVDRMLYCRRGEAAQGVQHSWRADVSIRQHVSTPLTKVHCIPFSNLLVRKPPKNDVCGSMYLLSGDNDSRGSG